MDGKRFMVAKVTARIVNVGQQLFTTYGGRRIITTHTVRKPCPLSLLHTIDPTIDPLIEQQALLTTASPALTLTRTSDARSLLKSQSTDDTITTWLWNSMDIHMTTSGRL